MSWKAVRRECCLDQGVVNSSSVGWEGRVQRTLLALGISITRLPGGIEWPGNLAAAARWKLLPKSKKLLQRQREIMRSSV